MPGIENLERERIAGIHCRDQLVIVPSLISGGVIHWFDERNGIMTRWSRCIHTYLMADVAKRFTKKGVHAKCGLSDAATLGARGLTVGNLAREIDLRSGRLGNLRDSSSGKPRYEWSTPQRRKREG